MTPEEFIEKKVKSCEKFVDNPVPTIKMNWLRTVLKEAIEFGAGQPGKLISHLTYEDGIQKGASEERRQILETLPEDRELAPRNEPEGRCEDTGYNTALRSVRLSHRTTKCMNKNFSWKYFRYIQLPKFLWYATGMFIWDSLHSYWWLNIAKKKPIWPDADQAGCDFKYCRFCGRGTSV